MARTDGNAAYVMAINPVAVVLIIPGRSREAEKPFPVSGLDTKSIRGSMISGVTWILLVEVKVFVMKFNPMFILRGVHTDRRTSPAS